MILAAYVFLLALFLSTALVPLLVRIAPALKLIDVPDKRKIHSALIPRIGGIAIIVGMLVPTLLWVPLDRHVQGYLIAVVLIAIFGVLDDRYDLDYRLKFLGQLTAALVVTLHGGVLISHFPFVPGEQLPFWVALPLTVLVIIGVTNAINLADGLDGLAGGTSLLVIGFFGLMAFRVGDYQVMMIALALIGGTLGFLRYNTFPARVFMGDCGSQFLGFSAAVLGIVLTQISNSALAPTLPLLVLGLPILDTLWVMLKRIMERRPPFSPDRTHIHHRLLDLGFNQYEAVTLIYTTQIGLIIAAFALAYSQDVLILGTYLLFCIVVILLLTVAQRRGLHIHASLSLRRHDFLAQLVAKARTRGWLSDRPYGLIALILPVMLLSGAIFAPWVAPDFGALSLSLLLLLSLALWIKPIPFFTLERLTVYSTVACVLYLLELQSGTPDALTTSARFLIVVLALLTGIWVRFSGEDAFTFNPLDYLVLLIIVLVPTSGGFEQPKFGIFAIELVILFYASEVLISAHERRWDSLRIGVFITLAVLAVRGLLGGW